MIDKQKIIEKVMEKLKDSKNVNHRKDHAITGSHVKEAISLTLDKAEQHFEKENEKHEHLICPMCYASVEKSIRQATAKAMIAEIEKWFETHTTFKKDWIEKWFETHTTFKKDWKKGNLFFSYDEWQNLKKEVLGEKE